MNRNLLFLLVAIVLGSAAWWTVKQNQKKNTLDKLDLNFAIPDTASITRIAITRENGTKIDLERKKEGYWEMNSKYRVAPNLMDLLLTTIRNVEMQRPVAKNEAETVNESFKTRFKKVEISVDNTIYKTYLVGDDAPGNLGTYFKFEEGDPYVCHLRGFTGFLSPRYNIMEHEWRDKTLFSSSPQTLQSVEIKYFKSPTDNFKFTLSGNNLNLEGVQKYDTTAAIRFLLGFKKLYLERYLKTFDKRTRDSLLKVTPEWSIDLVDIDKSKSHVVNFYPTNDEDRSMAYLPQTQEWISVQNPGLRPIKIRKFDLLSKNQ